MRFHNTIRLHVIEATIGRHKLAAWAGIGYFDTFALGDDAGAGQESG